MTDTTMSCTTYCTASSYNLAQIRHHFNDRASTTLYRDSLYIGWVGGHVFLFSYGCLVCWGLSQEEEQKILVEIRAFEMEPNSKIERDAVRFVYGTNAMIRKDVITVPDADSMMAQLAISYGLAQQIKLSVFESRIEETINRTQDLPKSLADNGYIPMSRREISRKIGHLFMVRSSVNLSSDILDTPDFFWEYTALEPLYQMTARYFSVAQRTEVLNKRCDIIHELFQMLGDDLNSRSAVRVEWIIVALISIEIFLTLVEIFKLV